MTPGEIEGWLRTIIKRKGTSEPEKQALRLAIDAVKVLNKMSPFVEKVLKEIADNSIDSNSASDSENSSRES